MKNSFPVEFPLAICFEAHACLPLVSALSFFQGKPEFNSLRRSLSSALVGGRELAFKGGFRGLTQRNSGEEGASWRPHSHFTDRKTDDREGTLLLPQALTIRPPYPL